MKKFLFVLAMLCASTAYAHGHGYIAGIQWIGTPYSLPSYGGGSGYRPRSYRIAPIPPVKQFRTAPVGDLQKQINRAVAEAEARNNARNARNRK